MKGSHLGRKALTAAVEGSSCGRLPLLQPAAVRISHPGPAQLPQSSICAAWAWVAAQDTQSSALAAQHTHSSVSAAHAPQSSASAVQAADSLGGLAEESEQNSTDQLALMSKAVAQHPEVQLLATVSAQSSAAAAQAAEAHALKIDDLRNLLEAAVLM